MLNPLRPRPARAAGWDPAAPPSEEFATSAPAILPGLPLGRAALALQSDPTPPVPATVPVATPAPAPVAVPVPVAAPATVTSGPPAGWYRDPGGGPGRRYWDGQAWTDHTAQ